MPRRKPKGNKSREQRIGKNPKRRTTPTLQDLLPKYRMVPTPKDETAQGQLDGWSKKGWKGEAKESRVTAYMNSYGLEQASLEIPFYEALWKKVDQQLDFPEDFVDLGAQGRVIVHVEVDSKGRFNGTILKAESPDGLLKTYSVAILLLALKEPIPKRLWLEKSVPVAFVFDYNVFNHIDQAREVDEGQRVYKNSLAFERTRYRENAISRMYKKIFTRYVPPIFPISWWLLRRLSRFISLHSKHWHC